MISAVDIGGTKIAVGEVCGSGKIVARLVLYLTFGCVLSVGFWAQPLVNNMTLHTAKQSALGLTASEGRAEGGSMVRDCVLE